MVTYIKRSLLKVLTHERQVDERVVGVPCGMLTSGVGVVGKGETCASMVDGAW